MTCVVRVLSLASSGAILSLRGLFVVVVWMAWFSVAWLEVGTAASMSCLARGGG